MCLLLSPCLCRYAHTHTLTHSLYFSLPPISLSNIIHSHGKKANCILQQKSRKECGLPSALAPITQVELGLNDYRAGQPHLLWPFPFQSGAENGDTLEREREPIATPVAPRRTRPGEPSSAKDLAGWKRCLRILLTGGETRDPERQEECAQVATKARQWVGRETLLIQGLPGDIVTTYGHIFLEKSHTLMPSCRL